MPQFTFRANIQSSIFPLLSELMGDDIIIDRGDQTFVPDYNPAASVAPVDRGIAHVMYAHNVMPSTYGYQSVGYNKYYDPVAEIGAKLDSAQLIISEEGLRTYIGIDYNGTGRIYVLSSGGIWILPGTSPSLNSNTIVTVATINGLSYIAVKGLGVWKYSSSSQAFTKVTLLGLDDSGINGILQSTGYLVVWSDTGVAWSAVDDPLDFRPSEVTGAGAGEIQEAKGKLTHCQQTSYGFIVYTENNAISATWSGNTNYPFNFKSIPGAGGVAGGDMVSPETVNAQYAYTTNGMQQIYHTGAKTVLSYLTDFIAGQVFEDFDEDTGELSTQSFSHTMRKKLTLVNDRYLVLSYGMNLAQPFTHAIVVDLAQTRTGKLKIQHNAVFELRNLSPEVIETPRESIAFLKEDGSVYVADFSIRNLQGTGVMLLGRYRLMRSNLSTLHEVHMENIQESASFSVKVYPLIDSKELKDPIPMTADPNISPSSGVRDFYEMLTGDTLVLLVQGSFNINTVVLTVSPNGVY